MTGFRLHLGASSGNYITVVELGLPTPDGSGVYTTSVQVNDSAIVFAAMTAFEIGGRQSVYSNEQVRLPTTTNQAPQAIITAPSGTVTIPVGGSVSFAGSATDPDNNLPLSYSWSFGGSGVAPSSAQSPGSVVFNQAGSFTVSFSATDGLGLSDPTPATVQIVVQSQGNQPPNSLIFNPAGPQTIKVGEYVAFFGLGSDADGPGPMTYSWSFGASGVPPSTSNSPGSVVFNQPGTFTVSFAVTDGLGATDPTPATVQIVVQSQANQPPQSTITAPVGPQTITAGGSVFFAGTGTDPDGNLPLSYGWSFGASGVSPSSAQSPGSVVFNQPGTFTVSFAVTDGLGATDPTPATVQIVVQSQANQPPQSTITAPVGPQTITAGGSVFFAGTGTDPDGNLPLSYSWSFGASGVAPSSAQSPGSVVFDQPGTFTVSFAVRDGLGTLDPTPATVQVVVQPAGGPSGEVEYLGDASVWRYFDQIRGRDTVYPSDFHGFPWNAPGFVDSSWPTGSGLFADGDMNGILPDVPVTRRVTYLYRAAFEVTQRPDALTASMLLDDGAVLYLNGVEVARENIAGEVTVSTFATTDIQGAAESEIVSVPLDPAALVIGTNVLAVEVHNFDKEPTADSGFQLTLVGSSGVAAGKAAAAAPASAPDPVFPESDVSVEVSLAATGFDSPAYLTAPAGDSRLFVLEADGRIWVVAKDGVRTTPFLDLSNDVGSGPDGGLLSLAFDPDYPQNGRFYVHRTAANGDAVLSRFSVGSDPDVADAGSEQEILRVPQPASGQNGGAIAFGPADGFLYVGLGDGGATGDPGNRAQDGTSLLGKLLRLDVSTPPAPGSLPMGAYAVPAGNPFVGDPGMRGEIWALGLRNPYRFSFDRERADLWLADEGQDAREELNFEPAGDAGGHNYGWDVMEGTACNDDDPTPVPGCNDASLVPPLYDYPHADGNCAITGGHVYRGAAQALVGQYFFADLCSGEVWSIDSETGAGTRWTGALGAAAGEPGELVSFGEGGDGSLYVLHLDGDIYRIGPKPRRWRVRWN